MMSKTHSQIKAALMRARTLISDPDHWTRGTLRARAKGLNQWPPKDPEDYSYCSFGAVEQACNLYRNDPMLTTDEPLANLAKTSLQHTLRQTHPGISVPQFNDRIATHQKVVELFDEAIERESRLAAQEVQS